MGDGFGDGEETMDVSIEGIRKQLLRDIECGDAGVIDERDNPFLSLIDRAYVTIEYLFEIGNRLAMAAVDERRRIAAELCQTYQVFSQRRKSFFRIHRIGRENGVWGDAFENAVAADECSIRFTCE